MTARAAIALTSLAAACVCALPASAAWDHPHGDGANTGFAKVLTARAVRPVRIVPVGELSTGAGPVIAADGTVYVGNLFGQLLAFHADGTPLWSRQLAAGRWIPASPVIGADGSVYVLSETRHLVDGTTGEFVYESALHKFEADGDPLLEAPFPEHFGGRGDANVAPNIWHSQDQDVVMAAALYDDRALHLVAFSSDGRVLGEAVVDPDEGGDISTVPFCDNYGWFRDLLCGGFRVPPEPPLACMNFSVCLADDTGGPQPGIAVWQNPRGGTPVVVVTDGLRDTVGYDFDPAKGFQERFRVHDTARIVASAPVVLPDGHAVVGTGEPAADKEMPHRGHLTFAGPSPAPPGDLGVGRLLSVDAAPTRLADGRLVAVDRSPRGHVSRMSVLALQGNQSTSTENHLDGESIASAAASCTYFYVASAGAFTTFDLRTLRPVASVPWFGGGRSSPAIGPDGHVYAVAADSMFVFPPGNAVTAIGTACALPVARPAAATADMRPSHGQRQGADAAMTLPNFLIIGAGKAGTTSVYEYLKQHPEVFVSAIKEPNFFVYAGQNPLVVQRSPETDFPVRTLADYRALFRDAAGARAIGEASPKYLLDPRAAERIRHHLPEVRLIVMLRHPAERAYSSYSMYVRDRLERRSFAQAIADEDLGIEDAAPRFGQKCYVAGGYFARQLRVYLGLFDRAQIAIHLFEDLEADAVGLMRRLFGFLEVADGFVPDTRLRHNSSRRPRNWLLRPLLHKSILTRSARRVLPDPLRRRAEAIQVAWRDRSAQAAPSMPREIRAGLVARYRDDILELQDLLGRDLTHWLV